MVLGAFLLLTVFLHTGYGFHVQIGKSNDMSYSLNSFRRQKREWIVPPSSVYEETDNSAKNPIARIQSDRQLDPGIIVTYRITGKGVTEHPYGLFVINPKTGDMNITGIVDREETPMYYLTGYAVDQYGNNVENPIELRVKVLDINDNSPVFTQEVFFGSVEEMSAQSTIVMRLNATDADEENTLNTKLAFRILSQEPGQSQIFMINKDTGEVRTIVSSIDREQQSSYTLTVEVKDRGGDQIGMAGTATVHVNVLDVNDNIPVLEKEMYEGSVEENTANVEILRMKVFDKDEEHTDNWLANFTIISGNEGGHFRIDVDSATNEGILVLEKELDYEELQNIDLKVVANNKAEYHSSVSSSSSGGGGGGGGSGSGVSKAKIVPIRVKVKNIPEGPMFKPKTKVFPVSENKKTSMKNQIIGSYPAYDGDTGKIAQHVKYAKEYDPDNWLIIDPITSEIRLSKIPDRESSYVSNGTYIAKILAISEDMPGKTATGTMAIQVEDANDNCPTIMNPVQTVCNDAKYINVTFKDQDSFPNSAPFTFTIVDEPVGTAKNWIIGHKDSTSIQLVPHDLQDNTHKVQILVTDMQGLSCPEKQVLELTACTCSAGSGCIERLSDKSARLGAGAIGLMILACLLLLLLPLLLLLCYCGGAGKGFTAIPDGTAEMLRSWNSEGAQPEDMAIPPLVPSSGNVEAEAFNRNGMETYADNKWKEYRNLHYWSEHGAAAGGATGAAVGAVVGAAAGAASGSVVGTAGRFLHVGGGAGASGAGGAFNEEFLKGYFGDKALSYAAEDDVQPARDCLLVYCQEGMGSPTGSVDCCSFFDDDMEEDLLDNLGPKFKTLAEICLGRQLSTNIEISQHSSYGEHVDMPSAVGMAVSGSSVYAGDQLGAVGSENTSSVYESNFHAPEFKIPEVITRQTMHTEESSRSGMQSASSKHDPQIHGSFLVTEKSYTTGPTLKPTIAIPNPRLQQNVLVTERVLAPASGFQGIVDIPDLSKGQNMVVKERVIQTDSGVPHVLTINERPDPQYVVVTERLLAPSSGLQTNLSIPDLTGGQNVVVTERLFTPIDNLQGGMRIPSEVSGVHSIVKERSVSGAGVQGQLLNTNTLLNQPSIMIGEPSTSNRNLSQSSSKVSKYSTVQYTR